MNIDEIKLAAESEEMRSRAFASFMSEATTRFMMSLVPQAEPKEALETLVRAAFDKGFSTGGGALAMQALTSMLSRKELNP